MQRRVTWPKRKLEASLNKLNSDQVKVVQKKENPNQPESHIFVELFVCRAAVLLRRLGLSQKTESGTGSFSGDSWWKKWTSSGGTNGEVRIRLEMLK